MGLSRRRALRIADRVALTTGGELLSAARTMLRPARPHGTPSQTLYAADNMEHPDIGHTGRERGDRSCLRRVPLRAPAPRIAVTVRQPGCRRAIRRRCGRAGIRAWRRSSGTYSVWLTSTPSRPTATGCG